ncbi:hypothetical protein SLEP1_g14578 [Rubroshorea leprosula]|uniref:Rab3-GAP regulatory subunit N-terminal domain-containing protein n=1 Tax=Rubroshorea leprosula TaxID=152421 RepID=A0AAV5IJM7_9ROSI|nr:hypothetical protein SLEP1_g14578 [Rubroshorea leprosula]
MSKRTHLTDLGCIACEELSDLGAGREGWLTDDPTVLCALEPNSLAIANRNLILVLGWSDPDEPRVNIRPDLSSTQAEYITAIEWLVFDDFRVVAVGTSKGYLLVYSLAGDLIHRQMVYPARILKLRVRGTKREMTQETSSSEEVSVVMAGVIARFDGSDILSMLQQWFQEMNSQFWDQKPKKRGPDDLENSYGRLPYQLWNVNKYGSCVDAAITGIMPPPLLELQSSQRYYCAVTIGDGAVISAFRLSEDRSRSLVGAILSKVVPATFSTIASFSKMIWRSEPTTNRKSEEKTQPFARGEACLVCTFNFFPSMMLSLQHKVMYPYLIFILPTEYYLITRIKYYWNLEGDSVIKNLDCFTKKLSQCRRCLYQLADLFLHDFSNVITTLFQHLNFYCKFYLWYFSFFLLAAFPVIVS